MVDIARSRGRAKITLGLSVLAAAGAVGWFWYQDDVVTGIGLAALILVAGYWEYTRRLADVRRAARAESEASERQRRDRE